MGLSITGVTFGLALLKANGSINGATSFVALKASGNVALVGITGLTASMTNATVAVNEAYDAGGNVIAQAVNFTGHNLSIPTGGTGTTPVTLDFAGSTFSATGTISISIGSFVYISGSVAFGKGSTFSAPLAGSSTPLSLTVLTIGASDANIFVGVGASDSTGAGGIGLSITGVTFGLALLKPTDGSAGSYYALKVTNGSVALVGVPGVTISATGLEVDVNGSDTAGVALDFSGNPLSVPTGGSGSTPVSLDFAGSLLQAKGTVTLGIAGASLTAFMTFLDATDSTGSVIDISVSNISVTLGSFSTGTLSAVGLLEIGHGGIAGSLTVHNVHFSVGDSSLGASFTSDATLAFNTSTTAVNTTINGSPLVVPAGSFFSVTLANASLVLNAGGVSATLLGTFAIQVAGGQTVVAATGVSTSFMYSGNGVSLTGGQGAIVIGTDGVAGILTGNFTGDFSSLGLTASAQVTLTFNTSATTDVNQTVTVAGHPIVVNVAKNTWHLGLSNATVSFGDFLTLSGNFTIGSGANGSTIYGATNVEVFFGDGPYRLADNSVNPDAIGLLISDGFVGAVQESAANGGGFAIYAQGHAQLVGLDGLTIDGIVTVKINQTGHAVTDVITMPSGATPTSVTMPFTTGAYTETVSGSVNISAAGILTIGGTFTFTLQPSGRVDVDIPDAQVNISVPISGSLTQVFGLDGDAKFSFGGGLGFQLQKLTLNGVTILGHTLSLGVSTGAPSPPTAELALPYAGQQIDAATINALGYIEVSVHGQQRRGPQRRVDHRLRGRDRADRSRGSRRHALRRRRPGRPDQQPGPVQVHVHRLLRRPTRTRATRTTPSASRSSRAASPTRTGTRTRRRTSSSSSTTRRSSRRRSSRAR